MKELLGIITKYGEQSPDVEVYDFTDPTPLSPEATAELQSRQVKLSTKEKESIRQSYQASRTCYLVLKRQKGVDLVERFNVPVNLENVALNEVHAVLERARKELLKKSNLTSSQNSV